MLNLLFYFTMSINVFKWVLRSLSRPLFRLRVCVVGGSCCFLVFYSSGVCFCLSFVPKAAETKGLCSGSTDQHHLKMASTSSTMQLSSSRFSYFDILCWIGLLFELCFPWSRLTVPSLLVCGCFLFPYTHSCVFSSCFLLFCMYISEPWFLVFCFKIKLHLDPYNLCFLSYYYNICADFIYHLFCQPCWKKKQ